MSPLIFLGALAAGAFLVVVGVSMVQEIRRRYVLEQHIRTLRADVAARENRIAELRRLREYLATDDYVERVAREKLNYRRPGERVVVIPAVPSPSPSPSPQPDEPTSVPPPPRAWFRHLFGPSPVVAPAVRPTNSPLP